MSNITKQATNILAYLSELDSLPLIKYWINNAEAILSFQHEQTGTQPSYTRKASWNTMSKSN